MTPTGPPFRYEFLSQKIRPAQVETAPEVLLVVMQIDVEMTRRIASRSGDSWFQISSPLQTLVNGEVTPEIHVSAGHCSSKIWPQTLNPIAIEWRFVFCYSKSLLEFLNPKTSCCWPNVGKLNSSHHNNVTFLTNGGARRMEPLPHYLCWLAQWGAQHRSSWLWESAFGQGLRFKPCVKHVTRCLWYCKCSDMLLRLTT